MMVKISYNQKLLSEKIRVADNMVSRLIGLMFRKAPLNSDGLLLEPCNSIHTFFMRYPLDVVFLDRGNKIVKIIRHLSPWRMTWIYLRARKTLELPAGSLPSEIKEGDVLEVKFV